MAQKRPDENWLTVEEFREKLLKEKKVSISKVAVGRQIEKFQKNHVEVKKGKFIDSNILFPVCGNKKIATVKIPVSDEKKNPPDELPNSLEVNEGSSSDMGQRLTVAIVEEKETKNQLAKFNLKERQKEYLKRDVIGPAIFDIGTLFLNNYKKGLRKQSIKVFDLSKLNPADALAEIDRANLEYYERIHKLVEKQIKKITKIEDKPL